MRTGAGLRSSCRCRWHMPRDQRLRSPRVAFSRALVSRLLTQVTDASTSRELKTISGTITGYPRG